MWGGALTQPEPNGRKGNGKARSPAGAEAEGIPVIRPVVHDGTDLHGGVEEAIRVLGNVPNLYQRDGQLVWIVRVSKEESSAKLLEGTPTIRLVPKAAVREMLCQYGSVLRWNDKADDWVPCKPCNDLVEALMARGQWRTVRPITGIVEAPMFLRDGSIMQTPGYDRQTGFVYEPTTDFPVVPETPSETDISDSKLALAEVWSEFPWRSQDDQSVVVALLLSFLCRPAFGDVPAFALDATTPGSGKGLAIDAASILATGRRSNKQTYAHDPIEQEKILGSMAMCGSQHVAFDDIKEPFGGPPLCKALTCGGATSFRILGKSEISNTPWIAVVTVTGNNIALQGDIPRRVVMARLEPETEKPELRTDFAHPRLLEWVTENRSRLVVAALTLVRGWWLADKPSMGMGTLGSFEDWAELVPRVCAWAGLGNPLECCPSNRDIEDPEVVALRCVLEQWPKVAPNGDTIGTILKRLWPEDMHGATPSYDGFDDLRAALTVLGPPKREGGVPSSNHIGRAFKRMTGRIVGGRKLVSKASHGGILMWRSVEILSKKTQPERNNSSNGVEMVGTVGTGGNSLIPARADESSNVGGVEKSQPSPPFQPCADIASEPGLFDDMLQTGEYSRADETSEWDD